MSSLHRDPRPVTPADLKRASYWGLRIPAPTPAVEPNPRDSWPAWTDADCWEPTVDPIDTTDHAAAFEPTPREQAWWAGFNLGYQGEPARPPADLADGLGLSWWCGYGAGETRRWREEILIDRLQARQSEPYEVRETDLYPAGATT